MDSNRRGNIAVGLVLLGVGGWFLAAQYFPQLNNLFHVEAQWPLLVVGIGLLFLITAVLFRTPGLAVPASILGGIGGILYYQNQTGDWASWSYAWALIPGFVGFGVMLNDLLEGHLWRGLKTGFSQILLSLLMFSVFSSFLGGPQFFRQLWPLFLIAAGVWILLKSARAKRSETAEVIQQ